MYKLILKRIIDFIIVFCVLLIIWLILLLITIWLHFANKGVGAFFTQKRPGRDGKIFKVIKFKTMTDERGADGNLLPDADRLTKVGRFVRTTFIEELPHIAREYGFGYFCALYYRNIYLNKSTNMRFAMEL